MFSIPVALTEFDALLHKSDMHNYLTAQTRSIHLWGGELRLYLAKLEQEGKQVEPKPTSILGQLVKKHGIVPSDAPFISGLINISHN